MSQSTEIMSDGVMSTGEGTRIFPDVEACIDCGGCVVACKRTWDVPHDEQRISIATMLEGQEAAQGLGKSQAIQQRESPGETSIPILRTRAPPGEPPSLECPEYPFWTIPLRPRGGLRE
jgi:formate dehydrogenase iron-sulfur subunit